MENTENKKTGAEEVLWDLDFMYSGVDDPQIDLDTKDLVKKMQDFNASYKGKLSEKLGQAIADYTEIKMLSEKIQIFLFLKQSLNTGDAVVKAKSAETDRILSRADGEYLTFARIELVSLDDAVLEKFYKAPPDGESLRDIKKRSADFLKALYGKYKNKNILIVGHEYPLWILSGTATGLSDNEIADWKIKTRNKDFIGLAESRKLKFFNLPLNKEGDLDLHRPYIDAIKIKCDKCEGDLFQRDDDKPETVRARLQTYEKQTSPLTGYYKKKKLLVDIDGELPLYQIFDNVCKEMDKIR